jgi:hypothetical protein
LPLGLDERAGRAPGRYVSAVTAETHDPAQTPGADRTHVARIVRIAAGVVVLEGVLVLIAFLAPAMRVLLRPAYLVVALLGLLSAWQAAWRRTRGDRRHENRRHES